MSLPAHIVVVDDDPIHLNLVERYLSKEGYRVSTADGGPAMRRILEKEPADLIILDLAMPEEHGFTVLADIRKTSDAGVIILTGSDDEVGSIVGLELGADDYVAKSSGLRELLARIRAVLRRVAGQSAPDLQGQKGERLVFQGWTLDHAARRLVSSRGEDVVLTTAEFDLLSTLATRSNRVLSREQLLDLIHDREWTPYDRSIDNLISQLRQKLGEDPRNPKLIKSVRGVGYIFAAQTSRE